MGFDAHERSVIFPNIAQEMEMARSMASLVHDQAKKVTSTAESLVSHLAGTVADNIQEDLFRNVTQQLMAIQDRLVIELNNLREAQSVQDTASG